MLEANRADLDRARSAGVTRAFARSPHPHRGAHRGDGRRPPARGGAARPRRRDRGGLAAAERRRDRAGARAPRRHRLHLRVPPQRHRGCRRALPQVRQCGAAARRQRGARVQHDHRADPGQGGREGGPAGRRHPVRRTPDRAAVMAMLTLDRYLDLIIPRGGEEFVRLVAERATVPVLKHDKGLCHVYVDEGADLDMAARHRPQCQGPSGERVQCAGDPARPRRRRRRPSCPWRPRASPRPEWSCAPTSGRASSCRMPCPPPPPTGTTEYLDYILAVRVVTTFEDGRRPHPAPRRPGWPRPS